MELTGTWLLDSFVISHADGRPEVYPFGLEPFGLLVYDPVGYMSATLSKSDREGLGVRRFEVASESTDAKKAAAFDSYLSYVGTWRLHDGVVTHRVLASLVPDTIGTELVRRATLDGGRLVLSYDVEARSGITRHYTLSWRRP